MLRVGLVVPHIFMHRDILPHIIFAPGQLAISLANQLQKENIEVTFFCPGPLDEVFKQVNADLSYFEAELEARGDSYMELLKKHPFTFITLARQVQSELVAKAYEMANDNKLDLVHIYGNEEDIALPFATFCQKPVIFTHHDPFNYLVKYRSVFPKYPDLNWISLSYAQRKTMPSNTNWVANVYHGLAPNKWQPNFKKGGYVAFLGRIIEPKGVHLAIRAIKKYNTLHPAAALKLKIAGKHYSDQSKDKYWKEMIEPELENDHIEYAGFINDIKEKQDFLKHARALLVPSTFSEPFGMVMIEALACGTPLIGLDSGAIPEIIKDGINGFIVPRTLTKKQPLGNKKAELDENKIATTIAKKLSEINSISRETCRKDFEERFSLEKMAREHATLYRNLVEK
jgi:glycosyltransferase involved in cell wall biosynthesis